ncbi:MAG: exodeoxyribonuclease VII small subunit [Gammaproteobacteria bacterium]|nr:exodeoxyribonuclease VII small subunit [Gammaproteobacteria bacterium]
MSSKKKQPPTFEESLTELEALVERMETGELSLEESLGAFEHGIALTRVCQDALQQAEQKVEILSSRDPAATPESFDDGA